MMKPQTKGGRLAVKWLLPWGSHDWLSRLVPSDVDITDCLEACCRYCEVNKDEQDDYREEELCALHQEICTVWNSDTV